MSATTHTLVVEVDEEYGARFPDLEAAMKWRVECSDSNSCEGFMECREVHEVGKWRETAEGPYECDEDCPWYDQEEFWFHGVLHTWHSGYAWTVPYDGCPVQASVAEPPGEAYPLLVGRYEVEPDWDDEFCYVTLTSAGEAQLSKARGAA
ncbi:MULTISPECIES: hypothetical protein [unclassified Rhodococcus (in: high G+C Gram-positive bacteria)]|uniref:hypothetical protein n=1 Tax=unclassified Rhodococcus (in: high G+C Gram-positive bacteria) TaxID=192944 RepID=UPI0006F77A02|nr:MULTISPECIES: hypothetical protein [unclassified Rhodococcus (in: high G+C Gram-positive bacteria)]KQU30319.1 hypothetical protein ASG69_04480 [Rhodococcus sp. Leaf225]KQU44776.1 hypothetical protein ASH03_12660 [Rhodococcus sp. Leaf258]